MRYVLTIIGLLVAGGGCWDFTHATNIMQQAVASVTILTGVVMCCSGCIMSEIRSLRDAPKKALD